jgi:hypothetical protein
LALLANNKKKKGEKWLLRFQRVTSTVQIAFIGKVPEISTQICIRLPYMTAMANAAIQKITEVQQAAQCHNVQISKPILTQDNAQKGKIKKSSYNELLCYYYEDFGNSSFMSLLLSVCNFAK